METDKYILNPSSVWKDDPLFIYTDFLSSVNRGKGFRETAKRIMDEYGLNTEKLEMIAGAVTESILKLDYRSTEEILEIYGNAFKEKDNPRSNLTIAVEAGKYIDVPIKFVLTSIVIYFKNKRG